TCVRSPATAIASCCAILASATAGGPYMRHEDNATHADALPVTPARVHQQQLHLQRTSPGASSPGCHMGWQRW
ncbi:hypothetical protein BC830DRAFT_1159873, partial [Chytriomyces sp. MP71]